MNAHKYRISEFVGEIYPILQRQRVVSSPGHLNFVTGPLQLSARMHRYVQGKHLFGAPSVRRALIDSAVSRIQHHRLYFVCVP